MPGTVPLGVQVLGPVAVHGATGWQAVPGQQGAVLAVLAAMHPHPVTTDVLLDELWGSCPPASARTALRVVLTRLRDRLAGGTSRAGGSSTGSVLVRDAGGYRLALADERFDHCQFTRLVDLATASLPDDPARAVQLLRPALALWRGSAFAPYAASDRVRAHAVRLEEQRKDAEELLVTALLESGWPAAAAAWATELVETEPYRERRWEQLMLALYRSGRQAEALQAARRAAHLVREELGIEPWPALRLLERDILQQAPTLDHRRDDGDRDAAERAIASGGDGRRAGSVPAMRGTFVDRDPDVEQLGALLDRERLVTLVGPPGVGKSRLAAHLAEAALGRRAIWLDLVPVAAEALVAELAELLGIRLGHPSAVDELAAAFPAQPTLLVLDNCEHLVAEAAELAEHLLEACPRLVVLATSRVPLATPSEHRHPVAPLPVDAALQLLLGRAGEDRAYRRQDLIALVEQVDRLPLSLELIAPALATASPSELTERLATSLEPAAARGQRDGRHDRLDGAIDWSVSLLTPGDRELFEQLGVFSGTFTSEDVAAVCERPRDDAASALARLAAAGLLAGAGQDGPTRWSQLNVLRVHARSRLAARGELARLSRAHAVRHVDLVETAARQLCGPDEDLAVARLDRSLPQLLATHRWLLAEQATEQSVRFSRSLWEYTFFRQHFGHYHWLDDSLALPGVEELPDYDLLLGDAALAAWARDRFAASLFRADAAETAAAARGRSIPLSALKARFNLAAEEQRMDEAAGLLMRLIGESADRADDRHHSDNLVVAALGLAQLGFDREAGDTAEQAATLARSTGNPSCLAWAGVGIGAAALRSDARRAARSFSAAARLARSVQNRWVEGMALSGLVTALRRQGRVEQARDLVVEVIDLWTRTRSTGQLARAGQEAVLLLAGSGERTAATRLLADLDLTGLPYPMLADDQACLDDLALSLDAGPTDDPAAAARAAAAGSAPAARWDQVVVAALDVLHSRPATDPAGALPRPAA